MNSYRVLIVEDEPLIAESLSDILDVLGHEVVGIADNANSALELVKNENPDLALLDIQIKGDKNGIQLSEEIKKLVPLPYIFTTAFADDETIENARKQGPFGYIVKPYGINDIKVAIQIAMSTHSTFKKLSEKQENLSVSDNNQLFIKSDSRLVKLITTDILYIEAKGDYVLFKTKEKGFVVHSTMKSVEEKMDTQLFIRVHRSYMININEIVDIEDSTLLIDKKVIPISKSYKEALMNKIQLF